MSKQTTFTYPLTADELHRALERGRMERSRAFLSWFGGSRNTREREQSRGAPCGDAAPSMG